MSGTEKVIKIYKKVKVCPRCSKTFVGFPALSRRDNKTDICPECGVSEALIDAGLHFGGHIEDDFLKKLELKKEKI